jgi:hypothetical protein
VLHDPFAHCVVDGIFPREFYEDIIDHWPAEESFVSLSATGRLKGGDDTRQVVLFSDAHFARLDEGRRSFWADQVGRWLMQPRFASAMVEKFSADLRVAAIRTEGRALAGDALIVSDRTNYAIGPHTDSPRRVVSMLFYLPEDAAFRRYGTSFYVPLDPAFRCAGGPHHQPTGFSRVKTVEFVPNRLVAFPKSDRCFHGVEQVDLPGIERRLLIYDVRFAS